MTRKVATMVLFGFWLLAGIAIGVILMAFLTIGTYQRGYDEGYFLRRPWRAELRARHLALADAHQRETAIAASSRMPALSPVAVTQRIAASGG